MIYLRKALLACLAVLMTMSSGWSQESATNGSATMESASLRFRPISVKETPDFQKHVIPLLGRLGCNARACHGSFQGQGGMALSLFGYDFNTDLRALTAQSESESGQRINREDPRSSLILRKAAALIDHEGGKRLDVDSWQYNLLERWIAAGTPGVISQRSIISLNVHPSSIRWEELGNRVPLKVEAIWSDGVREDVTCLTRFRINDDAIAALDDSYVLRGLGFGDTHLVAFYDNSVAAVPIVIAKPHASKIQWPREDSASQIDPWVNARLKSLHLVPSPICDDSEFLRRASIDLTGTLPPPSEVKAFLADTTANKREKKIDELLRRPAMAAWWANKLCDFTGCNPQQQAELGQELAEQWYMWLFHRLKDNMPYDQIVERILLATGREADESYWQYAERTSAFYGESSPTEFSERSMMQHFWSRRSVEKPADKALAVAHSFLGIRLQCAECHKHPFDRWTKENFHQFSRFFEDVQYGVAPESLDAYRQLSNRVGLKTRNDTDGAAINPEQLAKAKTGTIIPWREVYVRNRSMPITLNLLGQQNIVVEPKEDPRYHVMQWMRTADNPWFAKAIVNRVWASCFHVGIIDPPDDLNPANPPSNPELLNWLSDEFVRHNYDLRWLLREIAMSNTWQRSSLPNESNQRDRRHFSHAIPRRLPAEILYDGIKQVLCANDEQDTIREDLTRRAVGHLSMRMAGTYAMHVFGKPERAVTCDCERVNEPSLLQAIFLQNDPMIHLFLEESGWLEEIRSQSNPSEMQLQSWLEEAWLRAYSRLPRPEEKQRALQHLRKAESPAIGMEDLLWSLLNTKEFLLNH